MKVLFIGDSVTDCGRLREQSASLGQGYALMVAGELSYDLSGRDIEFANRGISGNKITDLLARWKRDCVSLAPDVVSVLVGVNDVWHEFYRGDGVSGERFEQIYDILLEETKALLPAAKIILCEPFMLEGTAFDDFQSMYAELATRRQTVERLAEKHGCAFVPLQEVFNKACETAPANYWLADGAHPTHAGHMLIAREWIKIFLELINDK